MDTLKRVKSLEGRVKSWFGMKRSLSVRYVLLLNSALLILNSSLHLSCQPKAPEPLNIGRVWQAQSVKEGAATVYTKGGAGNTKPGYVNFRLDLTDPKVARLRDIDNRELVGTWSVSPDNKRLILENLKPQPTNTIGTVEYYISTPPTENTLSLQRTAESRKTGNTVNEYQLIPAE